MNLTLEDAIYCLENNCRSCKFSNIRGIACQKEACTLAAEALRKYSAFDQIKWERDVALQQLSELGYSLGEKIRKDEWTPVAAGYPEPEVEVQITYVQRLRVDGDIVEKKGITNAIYEDGNVHTSESIWNWEDCGFEYDEETDDWIIPEGWWEYKHFNPADEYNHVVDLEVTAWRPLLKPY